MKITVITGSPHKKGTSALLADAFIGGAKEAGHDVFRFDAAFEKLAPCLACDKCSGGQDCVQKDGMEKLNPELLTSDLVAFVTPLYYYSLSAQLKAVIDRFYAQNDRLLGGGKKAVLIATANDSAADTFDALHAHYRQIIHYLQWSDAGTLFAYGCGTRKEIEATQYPAQAFAFGKQL
ncbi:MAG: flavodoxin family protein [Clostridia bacterium]